MNIMKIINKLGKVTAFIQKMSTRKKLIVGAGLLVLLIVLIIAVSSGDKSHEPATVAEVTRGDFTVTVTEEGNLKSMDTIDIRCEVEGHNITIVSLVEEGTYITEDDVADSKILVELDSSQFEEDLNRQKISMRSAEAAYTQAEKELEIQKKQNESDLNAAQMKVKFSRMDLEKYLGSELAERTINDTVNYQELIYDQALGGEARQSMLKFEGDIDLAKADLSRAKTKLENVIKMEKEGFVSSSDLEYAELDHKRMKNTVKQQEIARDLFVRYEFTKKTEELVSNYLESINELERTKTRSQAKLVKAQIDLESKKSRFDLEKERVEKLTDQVEKCTIRATNPGLVTYAQGRRWEEPLKEGSTVRKQQTLLTIPNLSKMGVDVNIQESHIDKIEKGQLANIKLEAFPDRPLTGKVVKIGIMPDSQHRWLSPDVKVYKVEIEIEGKHDYLKPGMSCDVEVVMDEIKDVLMIPVQAVMLHEGKKVCVVSSSSELREVEVGDYNNEYVEIRRGLKQGEKVLLYKPENLPSKLISLPKSKQKAAAEPLRKESP